LQISFSSSTSSSRTVSAPLFIRAIVCHFDSARFKVGARKKAFALAVCFPRRAPLHLGKTCLLFCYKVFYFISVFLSEKHEKQSASEFSSLSSIPCLLLAAPNVSQLSPETSPIYRLPD
jgi:hypothetical protein